MASLSMALAGSAGARMFAATAAAKGAGSGGAGGEKGLFDWILGGLQKEDQLVETDPILKKVAEKATSTTATGSRKSSGTTSVAVPKKKFGGFGGLFAKN
ncbi:uncharacterized protein LOC122041656 [Zingiber officinale]|uniref:uncharacterized protein LOC122041656 n=1 Tax=Zingiber officinale TaxID=94328 RepID=UPI001C4B0B67|nr:uncharacterized protein LOC122041656 [Zingiber officinale]